MIHQKLHLVATNRTTLCDDDDDDDDGTALRGDDDDDDDGDDDGKRDRESRPSRAMRHARTNVRRKSAFDG